LIVRSVLAIEGLLQAFRSAGVLLFKIHLEATASVRTQTKTRRLSLLHDELARSVAIFCYDRNHLLRRARPVKTTG
jgi:hypothetical protein